MVYVITGEINNFVDNILTRSLPEHYEFYKLFTGCIDNIYVRDIVIHQKRQEEYCLIINREGFNW